MKMLYTEVFLPDNLLPRGAVEYFNTHEDEFVLLNDRQMVPLPMEVYWQIRSKVIAINKGSYEVNVKPVKIEPIIEPVVEEVIDNVIEEVEEKPKKRAKKEL
jgi:hypothetical protein